MNLHTFTTLDSNYLLLKHNLLLIFGNWFFHGYQSSRLFHIHECKINIQSIFGNFYKFEKDSWNINLTWSYKTRQFALCKLISVSQTLLRIYSLFLFSFSCLSIVFHINFLHGQRRKMLYTRVVVKRYLACILIREEWVFVPFHKVNANKIIIHYLKRI